MSNLSDPEPLGPLFPKDEYNRKLEANVHPPDWENPVPSGKYNLVVIGAGTAGLVCAAGAAGVGAKVALIERDLMGGDCLNVGCVPSKAILASAHAAAAVRDAGELAIRVPEGEVKSDFPAVMERMRKLRAGISPHDSAERFSDLGIDVYLGQGKFSGENTIEVEGQTLHFKKAVIATGARASAPPISGLDKIEYLTNETLFSLTEMPERFAIVGAGPIGCEMSQAFARLGSQVTLFEVTDQIMGKEDADAAAVVQRSLEKDGVKIVLGEDDLEFSPNEDGTIRAGDELFNRVLIAVGRAPNVEGLNLEGAGVDFGKKGVTVNDRLQTTNKDIFAAGDICSHYQFTHAADFMARTVIRNALFFGRSKLSDLTIPWCTYTDPEVAHVGILASEINDEDHDTYRVDLKNVDRAILEGSTDGFAKIHTEKGKDKIVAATVVAKNGGDIISQVSQAMQAGIGLGKIANTISPYPTQAEVIRKAGDQYSKTRLTPTVEKIFRKWLEFARR
ncbi:MAG: mercuric reductase [Verrucomicrobiales bacterium]|nr:mercuric reductase [Verrucomicrobiales bacterium]